MQDSHEFLSHVLDAITEHIVVINAAGDIQLVNKSWSAFGHNNACVVGDNWQGVNYLQECDKAAAQGDEFGANAATGIRRVIENRQPLFYFEYPCHSLDENRWFMMRVSPFQHNNNNFFVISHQNITERKLAEDEVLKLSRIDELTDIANRRYFNEFIANEWQRCSRQGTPVSLALIDLDHFKLLNDCYGHQAGDACLKAVGQVLKRIARRPGDLCARYGGEEFVVVCSDTSLEQAQPLLAQLVDEIRSLNIPNELSPVLPTLTASIGLSSVQPNHNNTKCELIGKADKLLFAAKSNGRNQIAVG